MSRRRSNDETGRMACVVVVGGGGVYDGRFALVMKTWMLSRMLCHRVMRCPRMCPYSDIMSSFYVIVSVTSRTAMSRVPTYAPDVCAASHLPSHYREAGVLHPPQPERGTSDLRAALRHVQRAGYVSTAPSVVHTVLPV